jgi:hypothetical protein
MRHIRYYNNSSNPKEEDIPKKKEPTFWEKYKTYILIGIVVVAVILIFYLVSRKSTKSSNSSTSVVPTDPSSVTVEEFDGDIDISDEDFGASNDLEGESIDDIIIHRDVSGLPKSNIVYEYM